MPALSAERDHCQWIVKVRPAGPEGPARRARARSVAVAGQVTSILRGSVAAAVTEVFLIGSALIAVAFVTAFFLREIPLRTTRHSIAEEIGIELGAGIGEELEEELVEGAMNAASGSTVAGPSAG